MEKKPMDSGRYLNGQSFNSLTMEVIDHAKEREGENFEEKKAAQQSK